MRVCAVVKADAYGHGAGPVARAAAQAGVTQFAVATLAEAKALRQQGITTPILILGPLEPAELLGAAQARADVVAWSHEFVGHLERRVATEMNVHIKVDTGMGRLGARSGADAEKIAGRVGGSSRLRLAGVMTHFATADDPDDDFFEHQLARFALFASAIRRVSPRTLVHAANSAATLRDSRTHFNMVRCGIALYGLDPFHGERAPSGLEPALTLASYVAAVKDVHHGESVGYGRAFVARTPTRVAIIPLGYADGYRRGLGGKADVLIRGQRCPAVGRISMDSLSVDVGACKEVRQGDEAILIGRQGTEHVSAQELAKHLDTISYEVVSGLGARVERIYTAPTRDTPSSASPRTS